MPANHVLLQRTTLTVDAATVTLSSIPTTGYTDLKLVMSARTTYAGAQSDYLVVKFNGATTTYTGKLLIGTGTSVSSISPSGWRWFAEVNSNGQTAKTFGNAEVYIPNYSVTGIQKSYSSDSVSESNAATTEMELFSGLWDGTAAITSIEMASGNSGNIMAGSSFSLYGIANAVTTPAAAPKADGGDIIKTDGTYWYHAFTGSGIFTPQLNMTADVLVVAGGGGGGFERGGGGGAGGLQAFTSQALTSGSSYTCLVGAGGAGGTGYGTGMANGGDSRFGSLAFVKGGGYGGSGGNVGTSVGNAGGSSGGSGYYNQVSTAALGSQGNAGGASSTSGAAGGGGGGAGAVGAKAVAPAGGAGGVGVNTYSSWASITGTGANSGYYAGGGAGGNDNSGTTSGGLGGGGSTTASGATAGVAGSGGGGAAGSFGLSIYNGAAGGSGVVIIRYPV